MDRAKQSGWTDGTGDIVMIPDAQGVKRNIITEFGRLSTAEIRAHSQGYVISETRKAQNSMQMYLCLSNSLTKEAQEKIVDESSMYTISEITSGPLYFKLLMQKANLDNKATTFHLREQLTNLDTYMVTVESNVETFNNHVKKFRAGLRFRGERTDDLLINLFKGYYAAADKEFVSYMRTHKDRYSDGEDYTEEQLLNLALNKYTDLKREGKWTTLSSDQENIVALSADIEAIKRSNLQLAKGLIKGRKYQTDFGRKPTNVKGKNKSKSMSWMSVAPKDNEPLTMTVKGFKGVFHWCPHHKAWGAHKAEECRSKKSSNKSSKATSNKESYADSLATILEQIEDNDNEESSE